MKKDIDSIATSLGYRHIGGMQTNRVYLHTTHQEILKVALSAEPVTLEYASAQFRRCLDISAIYASEGLMPEVLEVGDDFYGTGCPWLREQYLPNNNLCVEYLRNPDFWIRNAPVELARIYKTIMSSDSADVTRTWHEKIQGLSCPVGFEDIYAEVVRAGEYLLKSHTTGYRIHGDLQFGNIIARRTDKRSKLWLIDWEVSEVMPLGYEYAMLYTFLLGPEGQVEEQYRQQYAQIKPLRAFWRTLAPFLANELGISPSEMKHSTVFRMGNGWLYQLQQAIDSGNTERAVELEKDLRLLVSHQCFDILPYP